MTATHRTPTRLKALREARGLTQLQIAAAAGLAIHTVSLAERGAVMTPATAAKLAAVLGVGTEEIRQ